MAWARYAGPHPEPSFSLPIPQALIDQPLGDPVAFSELGGDFGTGFRIRLEWGWGLGSFAGHNESVALPTGVTRSVSRWAALWLAGVRRRPEQGGPWVEVRLTPIEWIACCNEVGRRFKAREVLAVSNPQIVASFRDIERRPFCIINGIGEEWQYTPGKGVVKVS